MSFGIVYKFTNKVSGKVYVGVTTKTLEERLFAHINRPHHKNFIFTKIDDANTEVISETKESETL